MFGGSIVSWCHLVLNVGVEIWASYSVNTSIMPSGVTTSATGNNINKGNSQETSIL